MKVRPFHICQTVNDKSLHLLITTAPLIASVWLKFLGITDYYGSLLPFRFGLCSKASFLAQINGNMLAYFLNPLHNVSNREVQENA
jgi:predicted metalloprotease with PDZ domain